MKKEINMRKRKIPTEQGIIPNFNKNNGIITDPNGSYTGVVADDKYEIPVQDVDDL